MTFEKKSRARTSKIIAISAIGVLLIAGLTLNFLAQEPANQSLVISLNTTDDNEAVLEGGSLAERTATYILDVTNTDQSGGRNVTLKYNWTNPTNADVLGWSLSFNPEYIIVGSSDIEQVEVTIIAPVDALKNTGSIVKIYAWEYLDIAQPDLFLWNTTLGVSNGEVLLFTDVVEADLPRTPGPAPGQPTRITGMIGGQTFFNLLIGNSGFTPQRFSLSGIVGSGTRAELWPNAITFEPSDLSPILNYGETWPVKMNVRVPVDAEPGIYQLTVTAQGKTAQSEFVYTIDVPEADLYIDELTFSHLTILEEQEMTINVKIGNKGSKVADEFGVEVSARNPDGGWEVIGIKNITTGLNYGKTKMVSFNYKVGNEGLLTIRARVDQDNDIRESDNGNNIVEEDLEVIKSQDVSGSFFTHILLIVASVGAVTIFSRKKILKKR